MYNFLVSDIDNGGVYVCVRDEVYGKSLYFPLIFIINLKLLLKKAFNKNNNLEIQTKKNIKSNKKLHRREGYHVYLGHVDFEMLSTRSWV